MVKTASSSQLCSRNPVPYLRNVVVFGESGTGKSSIVNMLAGEPIFAVDDGACGTTFDHQGCAIKFGGGKHVLNVYDTAGLNEDKLGRVAPQVALQQLYDLLRNVGGINLLVFVTRPRITRNTTDNYRLIRAIFGGEKPPTVVAITGREGEDNGEWWDNNKGEFVKNGMTFHDHAIGTASTKFSTDPTYAELRTHLQRAIQKHGHQQNRRFVPSDVVDQNLNPEPLHRRFEAAFVRGFGLFVRFFGMCAEKLLVVYEEVLRSNGVDDGSVTVSVERVREKVEQKGRKRAKRVRQIKS
jgi:hypothetical protein